MSRTRRIRTVRNAVRAQNPATASAVSAAAAFDIKRNKNKAQKVFFYPLENLLCLAGETP
jgi:hypothetical protein